MLVVRKKGDISTLNWIVLCLVQTIFEINTSLCFGSKRYWKRVRLIVFVHENVNALKLCLFFTLWYFNEWNALLMVLFYFWNNSLLWKQGQCLYTCQWLSNARIEYHIQNKKILLIYIALIQLCSGFFPLFFIQFQIYPLGGAQCVSIAKTYCWWLGQIKSPQNQTCSKSVPGEVSCVQKVMPLSRHIGPSDLILSSNDVSGGILRAIFYLWQIELWLY